MAAHPVSPKKSLGQNFLIDPIHRARIVGSAGLTRDDVVLEIGAGDGSLTALIAGQAGRVIAVELDDRLIPVLQARFGANSRVTVVRGDIMEMPIERIWSASHTHTQELSTLGDETATHPKLSPICPTTSHLPSSASFWRRRRRRNLLVLTVQLE